MHDTADAEGEDAGGYADNRGDGGDGDQRDSDREGR